MPLDIKRRVFKSMKLHIGCGKKFLEGYKHVDIIPYSHVDYECDASDLKMIGDEAATEIYACHILEHVKRSVVTDVLVEWYRILKPNGQLRIAVPDFSAIVDEYVKNRDLRTLQGLVFGGQTYDYNYHHVAFDFDMLKDLLEGAGFTGVDRYDWREFLPPNYDDYSRAYLPHMNFENGRHMSLNVVATKLNLKDKTKD